MTKNDFSSKHIFVKTPDQHMNEETCKLFKLW